MFRRICNYLEFLEEYVDPENAFILCVDGVAPLAKMGQQRKRRYRAIDDIKIRNDIKKKFGKNISTNWNNTVITPGTEFMENLHITLLEYFEKRCKKIKYVYSSYHTPGEGEHKILQHIKSNMSNDDIMVIYGLDADLIFLSLACEHSDNIYLLREELHFESKKTENVKKIFDPTEDVVQDLIYVSIKETKNAFNNAIWTLVENRYDINIILPKETDFTKDLILICFLLGNDFLPHFPSIDIYKGGLDSIIASYIKCINGSNELLINIKDNKVIFNMPLIKTLIENLAKKENQFFKQDLHEYIDYSKRKYCRATDDYSIEVWNLENMRGIKTDDPIKLGIGHEDVWKFNYYEHYFGICEHQEEFIDNIIKLYLEGIVWVSKYYFEKCSDWRWHYPYDHAPFISDIYNYINKHKIDLNNIKLKTTDPVGIPTQLMSILPPQCVELMPKSHRNLVNNYLSPIIDMYPTKIKLDYLYKELFWQCIPILPTLDLARILDAVKDKNLLKIPYILYFFLVLLYHLLN